MKTAVNHRIALLAAAVGLAFGAPGATTAARVESAQLPFPLVPLQRLADQRGGFVGAEGLRMQLNMNLRQLVYVNDQLYNEIKLDLQQLTQVTFDDMESMREQVQAQREAIRAEVSEIERSLGEPTVTKAPTSVQPASAADQVTRAPSTPPRPSTELAAGAPRSTSSGAPASVPRTTSSTSSGTPRTTTGASASAPSVKSGATQATSTAVPVKSQPAASTRGSEIATRVEGAHTGAAGANANGTPAKTVGTTPVITQVAANNSARTASGEPVERTVVVQNGPNNHVDLDALRNLRGGMTIIQNTLSDQRIRHEMQVDVTLSGLRNLRTMDLLGGLNLQLRGAGK